MHESGHAPVALDQINIDPLGRECSDIGEERVPEIRMNRRSLPHDLRQIARRINIHFIRHISVSSLSQVDADIAQRNFHIACRHTGGQYHLVGEKFAGKIDDGILSACA